MKDDSQITTSVWMATTDEVAPAPLKGEVRADVCIVGGGIAGLTTAYLQLLEGKSVVVLDDGAIGGGMTGRTTAHLTNAFDDRYVEMERLHGEVGARLIAQSHTQAINRVERIVAEEKIECGFERLDGYLFAPTEEHHALLDDELRACHSAGLADVEKIERVPFESFNLGPALRFPNQAQFHPLHYLTGLAQAITSRGGELYSFSHVTTVTGGPTATVETKDGKVKCESIVVATNTPINDMVAIHTKQAAYVTYVIGIEIPRNSLKRALYWDTLEPYHYVRLQDDSDRFDLLIVGGEDHKTGQPDGLSPFETLERWSRDRFPDLGDLKYSWSGQVMEPVDGVAFIGRNPLDKDNVYIATGDSGQGMTHGTIAGLLLTDLIIGRKNDWEELYSPSRKTLKAIGEFAQENLNVAAQFTDYLTAGEVDSVEQIAPGCGAVVRNGLSKSATYRDNDGELIQLTAVCPHLGCLVNWNDLEKTWDCPCHGSRFSARGVVYQGPANKDLKALIP